MLQNGAEPRCYDSVALERALSTNSESGSPPEDAYRCVNRAVCGELGRCAVGSGILPDRWTPLPAQVAPEAESQAEIIELPRKPQTSRDLVA